MIGQIDRQTLQLFWCVSQQVPLIMQTGFVWEMLNCNCVTCEWVVHVFCSGNTELQLFIKCEGVANDVFCFGKTKSQLCIMSESIADVFW